MFVLGLLSVSATLLCETQHSHSRSKQTPVLANTCLGECYRVMLIQIIDLVLLGTHQSLRVE